MAEYLIVAKLDPSGVTQGAQKVKQDLQGVATQAATTNTAIGRAFDSAAYDKTIGALSGEVKKLRSELTSVAGAAAPAAAAVAAVANSNKAAVDSATNLTAKTTKSAEAMAKAAVAGADLTGATKDTSVAAVAAEAAQGTLVTVLTAVTAGETAAAVAGEVLAGVLSLGITVAVTAVVGAIAYFVSGLGDSEQASEAAAAALTKFQERQRDIGSFIDATTGRLITQNGVLIRNAQLLANADIEKKRSEVRGLGRNAFDTAANYKPGGNVFGDAKVQAVILKSKGNAVELERGIRALGKGYTALADEVGGYTARAVYANTELTELKGKQSDLNVAVKGGTVLNAGLVSSLAAVGSATTGVSKAQLNLNKLKEDAERIDRTTSGARRQTELAKNLELQKAAVKAVNDEKQAVVDTRKATSDANKEKSKAAAAARRDASAAASEAKRQAAEAERAADFIRKLEDDASGKAKPTALQQNISTKLSDFERQFNRKPTEGKGGEKERIVGALTQADAAATAKRFDEAYVQPLARLTALQNVTGLSREVLNRQLEETDRLGRALTPIEAAQIENSVRKGDALKREAEILASVHQPIEDYKAQIAALNELLAKGNISQTAYNAAVAALPLRQKGQDIVSNLPGTDPTSGKTYADIGAEDAENDRNAQVLADLEALEQAKVDIGIKYHDAREAEEKRHQENLRKIEQAAGQVRRDSVRSIFDSLLSITKDSVGKNNAVYKTLFFASKAFAIADGIIKTQQAVAAALAQPFPANIPLIAQAVAAGASVISTIASTNLNLKDGAGVVRGPGSSLSDSIPANLSAGEAVVNARGVSRGSNQAIVEAINAGAVFGGRGGASNDNGAGGAGGAQRGRVTVQQYEGVAIETQENLTTGDVTIIARRAVMQHAGEAVGKELANPNSRVSKSMQSNTNAGRRRN